MKQKPTNGSFGSDGQRIKFTELDFLEFLANLNYHVRVPELTYELAALSARRQHIPAVLVRASNDRLDFVFALSDHGPDRRIFGTNGTWSRALNFDVNALKDLAALGAQDGGDRRPSRLSLGNQIFCLLNEFQVGLLKIKESHDNQKCYAS